MALQRREFLTATSRLTRITLGFFAAGCTLVAVCQWGLVRIKYPESSLLVFVLTLISRLGEATIIACVVAFIFERLLSEERRVELSHIVGLHRRFQEFGFKETFVNRQSIFDQFFEHAFERVDRELKVLGICVSLFREADRVPRSGKALSSEHVIDRIATLLVDKECMIEILSLKRYPNGEELRAYGLTDGDFYYMRERDEDREHEFWHGRRLKNIANRAVGAWIRVYLEVAERTKNLEHTDRLLILQRLAVKEYLALPSLSLYILDEDIYVTPYLYRRHCSDVPAFQVAGKNAPLYKAYYSHFVELWNDKLTSWAIPYKFIELLASKPERTISNYNRLFKRISQEAEAQARKDSKYQEDPEFHRAEELAVIALLAEGNPGKAEH